MPVNKEAYLSLKRELDQQGVALVAVSKTKPIEEILELYELGQRDFGENYVQELVEKAAQLPGDIRWHFIGHLQTNKVKLIAPFVQLIHGVDSLKLLKEINKEAAKAGRVVNCLLQVHIAREETKFGLDEQELRNVLGGAATAEMKNVRICGLMGMASFSDNMEMVRMEFRGLKEIFAAIRGLSTPGSGLMTHDSRLRTHYSRLTAQDSGLATLSMGMSSDYRIAIEEGSTMVRIGSLLFGERGQK